MVSLGEDLRQLQEQLGKGYVPRGYRAIVGYMSRLRGRFAERDSECSVSALYQGCFDMTYFALFPPRLKSRGLKLAIVFDYESFGFEVWLAARNRAVQKRYWELLRDSGWSKHRLVEPAVGVDAIVARFVAEAAALNEPESLSARIEEAASELLGDLERLLAEHDAQ